MAKPIPDGLHTLTPQLNVDGAAEAMAFYAKAFGAEEVTRAMDPTGKKIWHAAMRIGSSQFFINDTSPEMGALPNPGSLWLYVDGVDAAFKRAVDAGAKVVMPLSDQFWGDRMGVVVDRWGNKWNFAQHVKDLSPTELQTAQDAFVASMSAPKK